MFTDLVRSTEIFEAVGDDGAERLRRAHFRMLRQAIADAGGEEVKNLGDGLMVMFASPRAAVSCAAWIHERFGAYNRRHPAVPLEVRIGVQSGEAVAAEGDYYGRAVVVAKRLCDLASGGQTMTTALVRDLTDDGVTFRFAMLDPVTVKGFEHPMVAYSVTSRQGLAPIPFPPELQSARSDRFVGREEELRRLRTTFTASAGSPRRVTFVSGEPGIGKTRLSGELARLAHDEGALVLYGRCDETFDFPYQPFVQPLRTFIRAFGPDRLLGSIGGRARALGRLVPELADSSAGTAPGLDTGSRMELFEAFEAWLVDAASERNLVLVLDDLHWADAGTLLLLRHVIAARSLEGALLIVNYRDTELGSAPPLATLLAEARRTPGVDSLRLGGLDVAGLERLLPTQLSDGGVTPGALYEATGGNPFFARELIAHLTEVDAAHGAAHGAADAAADPLLGEVGAVPAAVRDVVRQRLVTLSSAAQAVLTVAATIGSEFSVALVERVVFATRPASDDSLVAIEEALGAGLLVELPKATYAFAHALIRQTLYDDLSAARRVRLHLGVAEAIEAGPRPETQHTSLAHHYRAALPEAPVEKAIFYARAAGDSALAALAYESAVAHFESGIELSDPVADDHAAIRADLLLGLADAHLALGRLDDYRAAAARSAVEARLAASPTQLAKAAVRYTSLLATGVEDPLLPGLCEEALEALGDEAPDLRALVLAHLASFHTIQRADPVTGRRVAHQALIAGRRSGDPVATATALHAVVCSDVGQPDLDARQSLLDEADGIWSKLGSPKRVSGVGWGSDPRLRAGLELERGQLAAMRRTAAGMERFGIERKDWLAVAFAKSFRVVEELLRGRFDAAEETMAEMVEHGGQHPDVTAHYAAQFGWMMRERGRHSELLPLLAAAVEQNPLLTGFRTWYSLVLVEVGEAASAAHQLEVLSDGGFPALSPDHNYKLSLCGLAETCMALGDADRGAQLLKLLEPYQGQLAATGWGVLCVGAVDRYIAMLCELLGRFDEARRAYSTALALERSIDADAAVARTSLRMGRLLAARFPNNAGPEEPQRLLDQAGSISEQAGMQALLADASTVS